MKHIKEFYEIFNFFKKPTKKQIDFLNRHIDGFWEVDEKSGFINAWGSFGAKNSDIKSFQGIKFGIFNGDFYLDGNHFTSLIGSPQEVSNGFHCSNNDLTSLKGSPNKTGFFDCSYNSLTSLEGAPKEVGGTFKCSNNSLTSLEGSPVSVNGDFNCLNNYSLVSLEGAPQKIGMQFLCDRFTLLSGEWNPQGWLKILREGSEESKKLILTIPYFSLENISNIQKEIERNSSDWAYGLKGVWNKDYFKPIRDKLNVPKDFIEDAGLYGDLTSIGLDI